MKFSRGDAWMSLFGIVKIKRKDFTDLVPDIILKQHFQKDIRFDFMGNAGWELDKGKKYI